MKKLFFILLILSFTASCWAEGIVTLARPDGSLVTPALSGKTLSASYAVVSIAYTATSFGSDTNVAKLIVSVPLGTAYIGNSSVTGLRGISVAATQAAVTLDINDLSTLYWTGPAGQGLSFIVIK